MTEVSLPSYASVDGAGRIRLLDADPELGSSLLPDERSDARQFCTAPLLGFGHNRQWGELPVVDEPDCAGAMLLSGILLRQVNVGCRHGLQIYGSGDVVRPFLASGPPALPPGPAGSARWRALEDVSAVLLDRRLLKAAAAWPEVVAAILARASWQDDQRAALHASCQGPRLAPRLLMHLQYLAVRFGRVTPAGVRVPRGFSHQMFADMLSVRRTSVVAAVSALRHADLVRVDPRGGMLLDHAGLWKVSAQPQVA